MGQSRARIGRTHRLEKGNAVTQWTRETDVVVIGGGLAGYCAALEAAAANASVVLLEKQPQIGGSSSAVGWILCIQRHRFADGRRHRR